jgi:hypothetical protein
VAVLVAAVMFSIHILGSHEAEPKMSVRACVVVGVNPATVAMRSGGCHEREALS